MNATHMTDTYESSHENTQRHKWITGISTLRAIADNLVSILQDKAGSAPDRPYALGSVAQDAINKTTSKVEVPNDLVSLVNQGVNAIFDRNNNGQRLGNSPLFPIAVGVITLADSAVALEMARRDWERNKKIGTSSQIAAVASLAAAAVAVPAMMNGFRDLFSKEK